MNQTKIYKLPVKKNAAGMQDAEEAENQKHLNSILDNKLAPILYNRDSSLVMLRCYKMTIFKLTELDELPKDMFTPEDIDCGLERLLDVPNFSRCSVTEKLAVFEKYVENCTKTTTKIAQPVYARTQRYPVAAKTPQSADYVIEAAPNDPNIENLKRRRDDDYYIENNLSDIVRFRGEEQTEKKPYLKKIAAVTVAAALLTLGYVTYSNVDKDHLHAMAGRALQKTEDASFAIYDLFDDIYKKISR